MIHRIQDLLTRHEPANDRFYTVAIDGRGGSGKSTLTDQLRDLMIGFTVMNGDDYFEPVIDDLVWGAFNDDRFIQDVINPLKTGNTFNYRPYTWNSSRATNVNAKTVDVVTGFCLERCFSFDFDIPWDLKIWVETPKEICLKRGLARENQERDRILNAWTTVWEPLWDAHIVNHNPAAHADIVLDGTKPFEAQITY